MAERQQPSTEAPARPTRQAAGQVARGIRQVGQRAEELGETTGINPIMRGMAEVPTYVYYGALLASMGASVSLFLLGRRWTSLFVGLWAPTVLNLGLFNRMQRELRHR